MVENCTHCTQMSLESTHVEQDYSRLRGLQTSQAESQPQQTDRSLVSGPQPQQPSTVQQSVPETIEEGPGGAAGHREPVRLRGRTSRSDRNQAWGASLSRDQIPQASSYRGVLSYSGSNQNVVNVRNADKAVSSSSDEEGVVCGCMANAPHPSKQRPMSMYEAYVCEESPRNANLADSDSDSSLVDCKCRRTRSLYGMRNRKLDGAEEGLFSDVIDSYLAKSQSSCVNPNSHVNKNRYSLGDMPWMNEEDMKDGFLNKRTQKVDNGRNVRETPPQPGLHGNMAAPVVDNSFFQRMRENLHQFDRNNRRNQRSNANANQVDNGNRNIANEAQSQGKVDLPQDASNSNCPFLPNDRNHLLHQSCDLIAQKIGESEQKSRSLSGIADAEDVPMETVPSNSVNYNLDESDDESDESRLSLSYYVDMEKSVIIQSDISEHYRTDKIQYLESPSSSHPDQSTSFEEASTPVETPATYKYNANTQKDLDPQMIANHKQQPSTNARFKTETKTIMLEKSDKSNQNTMKSSTSGEVSASAAEGPNNEEEKTEKASSSPQLNVSQTKKEEQQKPRQRLGELLLSSGQLSVN